MIINFPITRYHDASLRYFSFPNKPLSAVSKVPYLSNSIRTPYHDKLIHDWPNKISSSFISFHFLLFASFEPASCCKIIRITEAPCPACCWGETSGPCAAGHFARPSPRPGWRAHPTYILYIYICIYICIHG